MAKAYSEARRQHGDSELLDTIASTKPEVDHTRYHSPEELKEHGLQHLRDAVALLEHAEATGDGTSLSEAREIFERLKARPWLERVTAAGAHELQVPA